MRDIAVASAGGESLCGPRALGFATANALSGQGTGDRRSALAQRRPGSLRTEPHAPPGPRDPPAATVAGRIERRPPTASWPTRSNRTIATPTCGSRSRPSCSSGSLPNSIRRSAPSTIALPARRSAASRSRTPKTRSSLQPDAERWHVNLESDGTVDSDTVADGGQVKSTRCGTTSFTAQKSIVVERGRRRVGESTADAHNTSRLVGVRSDLDWMPIVNDMVRSRAIDEYHKKRSRAKAEVECKVAGRVEQQLDDRAGDAVNKVQNQMREQVTRPARSRPASSSRRSNSRRRPSASSPACEWPARSNSAATRRGRGPRPTAWPACRCTNRRSRTRR